MTVFLDAVRAALCSNQENRVITRIMVPMTISDLRRRLVRLMNAIGLTLMPLLVCSLSGARLALLPSEQQPKRPELVDRLFLTLKSENKPFTLITRIYLKPGAEREFESIAIRVGKASSAERGCLTYEFHRDLEKPTNYTLIEKWTGLTPLRNHLLLDHTKQIQTAFAEMSTTPRTTEIFAPINGK